SGQDHGEVDVLIHAGRRQLTNADRRQLGGAQPFHVAPASQGDDGYAHPDRVAGGGAAGARKRVEGDVDLPVAREVRGVGRRRLQLDPGGIDSATGESSPPHVPCAAPGESTVLEYQATAFDQPQDPRPGVDHVEVDLGDIVEAAEYHSLGRLALGRRLRDGACRGAVAERTPGQ